MNLSLLEEIITREPTYRIKQIKKELYERLITGWDEATCLPAGLRGKLAQKCPLEINAKVFESKDKRTVKALITLEDGLKIESVLMRYPQRNTVCISTQVGCPMGCVFCATGKMGFKRNLTADEIVDQVVFFARYLKPLGEKVSRVVLMGMGEPFLNFENVVQAIKVLNDPQGLALGARKISVSTVGLADKIRGFADLDLQTNLALSLHAPTDELRAKLIPAHTSLKELFLAVDDYLAKTGRKVMIEYVMLAGINDSREMAVQLAKLLGKRMVMVNLIRYNPTPDDFLRLQSNRSDSLEVGSISNPPIPGEYIRTLPRCLAGKSTTASAIKFSHPGGDNIGSSEVGEIFRPSSQKTIEVFKAILEETGIEVTQRYSFGTDINAACGQLAAKQL